MKKWDAYDGFGHGSEPSAFSPQKNGKKKTPWAFQTSSAKESKKKKKTAWAHEARETYQSKSLGKGRKENWAYVLIAYKKPKKSWAYATPKGNGHKGDLAIIILVSVFLMLVYLVNFPQ